MSKRHICIFTTINSSEGKALQQIFETVSSGFLPAGVQLLFKQIQPGNTQAGVDVTNFLNEHVHQGEKPELAILMGIAGGIESSEIGAVATCDTVLDYEYEKVTAEGREQRYPAWTIPVRIKQLITSKQDELAARTRELANKALRNDEPVKISNVWIISGNKVIDPYPGESAEFRLPPESVYTLEQLHKKLPRVYAIEMEGAGFARACESMAPRIPWLIIRGISDNSRNRKQDIDQPTAAINAAAYARAFVELYCKEHSQPPRDVYPSFCGKYHEKEAACRVLKEAQLGLEQAAKDIERIRRSTEVIRDISHRGITKVGLPQEFNRDYENFFNSDYHEAKEMGLMGTGLRRVFEKHLSGDSAPAEYKKARRHLLDAVSNEMQLKVLINNPFPIARNQGEFSVGMHALSNEVLRYDAPGQLLDFPWVWAFLLTRQKENLPQNSVASLKALHAIWKEIPERKRGNLQVKLSYLPFHVTINYRTHSRKVDHNSSRPDEHLVLAQHYMDFGLSKKSNAIRLEGVNDDTASGFIDSYLNEFGRYWDEEECKFADYMFKVDFNDVGMKITRLGLPTTSYA